MTTKKEQLINTLTESYNTRIDALMQEIDTKQRELDELLRCRDGLASERNEKIQLIEDYFRALEISKINIKEVVNGGTDIS